MLVGMTGPHVDAARDLLAYIDASPTPFHACANAAARLDAAGFSALEETASWPTSGGRHYVVRDGSLVAWAAPAPASPTLPFSVIGAHTDSPNLRVKPHPDVSRAGARLVAVEVYGGPLFNSWLDRDLGIAGRVAMRGGRMALLHVDRAVARVPQLAVHLDRDVNTKGLVLNPQQHVVPVWSLGDGVDFRAFVAAELDVAPADVLAWDVMLHDVQPGELLGQRDEMISAPRLDNLCSAWAAIEALTASTPAAAVHVVALFDHEEIGSTSNRGADSALLSTVLERINASLGGGREDFHRALAASTCVSVDMAHATHPNYPERHEPLHQLTLDGGPAVKTNVSQRYASDARSIAALVEACDGAGVELQQYAHRGDMPCGSTIGPVTAARLGISTADLGAPQLSMHSARELMATVGPSQLRAALTAFLADAPDRPRA